MEEQDLIVVGVDGSESARAALDFALGEAARRSARVRVVAVYEPPDHWALGYGMAAAMVVPPSPVELAEWAESAAEETVTAAVRDAGPAARAVPLDVRVVPGRAAMALLDQADHADLLVVGHRGRGAVASACLGSVGLECVLRARCPVAVVRAPAAAPAGPA